MIVTWYGEGCFKFQSGERTVLTDPFGSEAGLTPYRGKTDVVLHTMRLFPVPYALSEEGFVAMGPGEYEVQGVSLEGWPAAPHRGGEGSVTAFYRFVMEEIRVGVVGYGSAVRETMLEHLGGVDLLLIPAGGAPFIPEEEAAKLVKQLEPKLVIPSFFKVSGLTRKAGSVADFCTELGHKEGEAMEKFVVKKKDIPEQMQVMVLKI